MPVHKSGSFEDRLCGIAVGLLQKDYGDDLLQRSQSGKNYAKFDWTAKFSEKIVSSYVKEHGRIPDMGLIHARLVNNVWRQARLRAARINLGGSIPSANGNYAASNGRENAKNGKGILMVSNLGDKDTGLLIEYLEAIQQRETPKELPPRLQQYVMKDESLEKILEVIGDEFNAIQALAEDGVGMNIGISAEKLQKLSVDQLQVMVNEVVKKQSVRKGKKGRGKRVVKRTKEEAGNLRLYTLLSSKELMVGLAKSVQRGEAIMWPVTITLDDGTKVSFLTVATMVRQQMTRDSLFLPALLV